MSEIVVSTRRVYQAPIKGSRIRFTRRRALEDWAHMLVRAWLHERCECEADEHDESGRETYRGRCRAHEAADAGDGRGVFDLYVRAGMKRRLFRMLRDGWRPAFDIAARLSLAREDA